MKRHRFISSRDKTTSFYQPSFPKIRGVPVCRPLFATGGGEGGGWGQAGGNRAASPAAVALGSESSQDFGASGGGR